MVVINTYNQVQRTIRGIIMSNEEIKAKELVDKFKPYSHFWVHDFGHQKDYDAEQHENAKLCALICVDDEINLVKSIIDKSVNIHQSLSTPKKLCIDFLNPLLKELETIKQIIEQL